MMCYKVVQSDEGNILGKVPPPPNPPLGDHLPPLPPDWVSTPRPKNSESPCRKTTEYTFCLVLRSPQLPSPPFRAKYYRIVFAPFEAGILHPNVWPTLPNFLRAIHFCHRSYPRPPLWGSPYKIFEKWSKISQLYPNFAPNPQNYYIFGSLVKCYSYVRHMNIPPIPPWR